MTNVGKLKFDAETGAADEFKSQLAKIWSLVRPKNVIFIYTTSTACQFFHGQHIEAAKDEDDDSLIGATNLAQLLNAEFANCPQYECQFFDRPPRPTASQQQTLSIAQLKRDILEGSETGFVTVLGGEELRGGVKDASDHFGFCVQSFACTNSSYISDFTRQQILSQNNWQLPKDQALLDKYMKKQPARTLNSTTFHTEETVSTSYLAWLMKERNFANFKITHFLRYKFVNYWNSYLTPLLQKRHEQKKEKNVLASTINKLIQNSHYGRQGMESSNYDQTILTTGENLCKIRKTRLGHLSGKNLTLLGLVRLKQKKASKGGQKKKK